MMDRTESRDRVIPLVALLVITAVMIAAYGRIDPELFSGVDLKQYRAIAAVSPEISNDIPRPFAYRLLGPYVVGLLPIPDNLGFYMLALLSSLALVTLLFFSLCHFGINPSIASFTAVLFVMNRYMFGFTVWDYFQINDLLSLIYIVVLFRALHRFRWGVFALILLLGALTRETALLMIPTAVVYLIENGRLKSDWRLMAVAMLPAIAAFLLLRLLIQPSEGANLFEAFSTCITKLQSPDVWYRLLLNAFTPLTLVPIIYFRQTRRFFSENRHMLWFVVFVYISSLFGSDTERLLAPAFIVFYMLIATIIEDNLWKSRGILIVLIGCAFLSSLHHLYAAFPLPGRDVTIAVSVGSLLLVTLTLFAHRLHERTRQSLVGQKSETFDNSI